MYIILAKALTFAQKAEISKHSPTICTHFKFILQSESASDKVKSERKTGGKHMNTIGFNTNDSKAEAAEICKRKATRKLR